MSYVKDVEYPMCDVKNGHFSISHVCYSKFFADNDFSKFTRPHLHKEKKSKKNLCMLLM